MRHLNRLISLTHPARRPSGQIATFLLLAMVGVLILALATANLGTTSVAATKAANTADAAALEMGSELATRANRLINTKGLDGRTERCQRSGMLGVVLAVVLAIAIVVAQQYELLPALIAVIPGATVTTVAAVNAALWGAMAGAVGGAIGGGIAQGSATGAVLGGLQGAAIGAAIGYGVGAGLYAGPGAAGGGLTAGSPALLGSSAPAAGIYATGAAAAAQAAPLATPVLATSTSGAIAGGTLATGATVYNPTVEEQRREANFNREVEGLRARPGERDQLRNAILHRLFSRTVDDPNEVEDPQTHAKRPAFDVWWEEREERFQALFPLIMADVQAFLDGPMTTFETQAEAAYLAGGASQCGDGVCAFDEGCGWVNECPVDCGVCPSEGGSDE